MKRGLKQVRRRGRLAKLTKICVRRPAGFRVLSRWIPTIAPNKVAATRRIITWANCLESCSPEVSSCQRASIIDFVLIFSSGNRFWRCQRHECKLDRAALFSRPNH